MKEIQVFRRGDVACLYNVFTLEKTYVPAAEGEGAQAASREVSPASLAVPAPSRHVYQAVTTLACDLSCKYCSVFRNPCALEGTSMSLETARQLVERYRRTVGEGLFIITGGEPMLNRPVLEYLIREVRGTKILFTNGQLMDEGLLVALRENGVLPIFSMDGTPPVHDAMRTRKTGGSSHARVAEAVRLARRLGLVYGLSLVVREHNIETLEREISFLLEEFTPASLGINFPHYAAYSAFQIDPALYARKLLEIFPLCKRHGVFVDQISRRLGPLVEQRFRFRDCSAMGQKIVEFPDGSFSNCINIPGGRDMPAADVWGERLPVRLDECQDCWAIGTCGGGCSYDGIQFRGPGKVDQRNCVITKILVEALLWDIYDELGERRPSPEAMRRAYGPVLNPKSALSRSVGHDART